MALEIFKLVGSVFVDTASAEKSLQKTDKKAGSLGATLVNGIKSVGKFAATMGTAVVAAGGAVVALTESTREYRTEQGKLEAAFKAAGFEGNEARTTYEALNGVLGDSGQAVEAANHLALLCDSEEELATMTNAMTGIYATFGDSLPLEGLAEAANETAKVGTVTGSLADALNWVSLGSDGWRAALGGNEKALKAFSRASRSGASNEEAFTAALQACSTEQERQALITSTLNVAYGDAADAYREVNGEVIAANIAQDNLTNAMANVGEKLEPIVTQGKELLTQVLTKASPYIESLANVVVPALVSVLSGLVDGVDLVIQGVQDGLSWLQQIGAYAAETFQPIIDDLATAFNWVKQQLDPFITALGEYFTSGQAAEGVTNTVKAAIDFLADAYVAVKGLIAEVVQGFQDANAWMLEHETMLTLVGIAVGTLTAAIIAYNTAQAIKNAGGIVELAQLALLQVQLWGLTAAEAAHTAASTVAATVTTAFGAAVNFLTSPITLVVLAIGALIAIIYLLVTNWDTVKEVAANVWAKVQEIWAAVAAWFDTNVVQPVKSGFETATEAVKNAFLNAWTGIQNAWSAVSGFFSGIWSSITATFSNVTNWFRDTFSQAWQAVKDVFSTGGKIFDGIKSGISDVFKTTVNAIIRGLNKVISVPFNKINDILTSVRNVSVAGITPFSFVGSISVPQIPELEEGAVLERGQVGLLEGNGAEAVVPLHKNREWTRAVARDMDTALGGSSDSKVVDVLLDILAAIEAMTGLGIYLDTDALVGSLAKPLDRKLGQLQAAKARG